MQSFGDSPRAVDIGFSGGGGMSMRLDEATYRALREALGSDRSERWHAIDAAEGAEVILDLSQVVFIRLDTQEKRAGFGGF
jgi:hypothetical protein